jgi:hypothetical protein
MEQEQQVRAGLPFELYHRAAILHERWENNVIRPFARTLDWGATLML